MVRSKKSHISISMRDNALHRSLVKAMDGAPDFMLGAPGVIILVSPPETHPDEYYAGATNVLFGGQDMPYAQNSDNALIAIAGNTTDRTDSDYEAEYRWKKRILVLTPTVDLVPRSIRLAADHILQIPPLTASDLQAAYKEVFSVETSRKLAKEALTFCRADLWNASRPGRPLADVLRRIRAYPEPPVTNNRVQKTSPKLEDLHGFGPAQDWGLQLAADLAAWRAGQIGWEDVDKGLLLHGAPGTGKTLYASALANTCGVEFIATSLGQWQASGYLSDLLKAMRRDFAEAKKKAPSILFIDEIDSIGDRGAFENQHRSYNVQVVNALLECLDGTVNRDGVIVIGATNHPAMIDPAVIRAGRLDKHIEIPLPDTQARAAIILQYIDNALSLAEIEEVLPRTSGFSGADLAQLCRQARRSARVQKRSVTVSDLVEHLPNVLPVEGDYRRSIAIHEAGHTVVGVRLNYGKFLGVAIAGYLRSGTTQPAGGAAFDTSGLMFRNRQSYLDEICTLLAGIAAEEFVLGTFGDGAGGGRGSDLERATDVATQIETQFGMGKTVRHTIARDAHDLEQVRRGDPDLRERIERIVDEQFQRAKNIVAADEGLLNLLTEELVAKGGCTPASFETLLERDATSQTTLPEWQALEQLGSYSWKTDR